MAAVCAAECALAALALRREKAHSGRSPIRTEPAASRQICEGIGAEPGANRVGFPSRRRSDRAEPEEIIGHVEDERQTHPDRCGPLAAHRSARERAPDHAESAPHRAGRRGAQPPGMAAKPP